MNTLKLLFASMVFITSISAVANDMKPQTFAPTQHSYAYFAAPCSKHGCTFYSGTIINPTPSTLIDQNNPSSADQIVSTVKLFKSRNIPLTKDNLNAFFIDSK